MDRIGADLDGPLLRKIRDISYEALFIMGDHRSGTTILNKILGATGCFNIITAYHVICFKELLHHYVNRSVEEAKKELSSRFVRAGVFQRGIDRVPISPETPEEYAFVLRNGGYRPQLSPHNLQDLVLLCQKATFTGDGGKPVLLKNPWDFLNFEYVKQAFPESRFIFIHRHPVRTINSQLGATRSIFSQRNAYIAMVVDWYGSVFRRRTKRRFFECLFSSRFGLGFRITSRHVFRATGYFLKNSRKLPPSDHINVRYEDLCDAPGPTIEKIMGWLKVEPPRSLSWESFIEVREGLLLPEVMKRRRWICENTRGYLSSFGYRCEEAV
jgi:hypothetical protein